MFKRVALLIGLVFAGSFYSSAATVVWGAAQNNGFSMTNGSELPAGNLVRLGTFMNMSDDEIRSAASDITFLNSRFIEAGNARIGDGLMGAPSNFSAVSNPNTGSGPNGLNITGAQIYLWAFASGDNSSVAQSIATATQIGIFYLDKAVDSRWAFPAQDPVPGSTSIDLSDLTDLPGTSLVTGAHLVYGEFPKGSSAAGGAPNFGLIPEPSSVLLLAAGTLALAGRRRR